MLAMWRQVIFTFLLHMCSVKAASEWNTKDFLRREHSLIKPYQGTGMTIPYWDFLGSTIVTNNYIRLTPDEQSRQGGLWNSVPCYIRNWELQVQFKVHGEGKHLFGDGLVIWYTRDKMTLGPVFGSKDYFVGLAVILDTYSNHNGEHNHQHPYISAMVNNGTLHYDHDRDGTHTQLAGCEAKFRNVDHDTYISIRYEQDTLYVYTDIHNKANWKECFTVKGIQLPLGYHFGITAATGDLSDNHDVLSVRLYQLDTAEQVKDDEDRSKILPQAASMEPPREHVPDEPARSNFLKWFFIVVFGFLFMAAIAVGGLWYYKNKYYETRKRFY